MRKNLFYLLISILVFTNISAADGRFIHRNVVNNMFYFAGSPDANGQMTWNKIDGQAKDVAITADGQMICVGTDDAIWYSSGVDANGKANWKKQNGTAATHVAARGDKFLHRNSANNMYYFSGKADSNGQMTWKQIDGQAKSIAIAGDGKMICVGTDDAIWYSSGVDANGKANWKKQNGTAATHVAIGGSNKFLHRNSANNMYYFAGDADANGQMTWKQIDGAAKNIALTGDGQMMHVGTDDAIYYSSGLDANGKPNWKRQNGTAATHVAAAGITRVASSTSYTFNPNIEGTGKVTFNSNWKFDDKGILKFKARGKKEVVVVLSPEQTQTPAGGKIYKLAIGRGNNDYTSLLGNSDYSIALGANVSVGMTQPDWGDYWLQLNNNVLSFGTGTTAGSNIKGSWTIAADKQITPKFFGLGGWDQQVEYSNIEITSPSPKIETPSSFSAQIWGVNGSDQIYYRAGIDASNPFGKSWQKVDGALKNISVGPNGQIWGVNAGDQIYYRTGINTSNPFGTAWQNVAGALKQISVGPNGQIWGVNANDQIYYRTGIDASNPFGKAWQNVAGALKHISVGANGQIWGVNAGDQIYYRTGINASNPFGTAWQNVAGALKNISVGPNGQVWGVNAGDQIYYRTGIDASNPFGKTWQNVAGALKQISVGPNGQVWGVNAGDQIYYRAGIDASNPFGTAWQNVPGALKNISVQAFTQTSVDTTGVTTTKVSTATGTTTVLEYNKIVRIQSKFGGMVWTHPYYRDEKVKGTANDSLELLVNSADARATNGCDFFMLKSADNASKTGAVNYGDKIEIYSLNTTSGDPAYNKTWPLNKKWVANGDSYWTAARHGEVLIVGPENPNFKDNLRIFSIVSNSGKTGPINYNDEVRIVASLPNSTLSNDLWIGDAHPKWGANFKPIHIDDKTDKRAGMVNVRGIFKFLAPDQAKLIDPNGIAQKVLAEIGDIPSPSDFPADYVSITPKEDLDNVTVGSKDGKLEIWALDSKDKPYRFNEFAGAPYTMPDATIDPWELQTLKDESGKDIPGLEDIFATCDGNLFGIKSDDKTAVKYDFTKKQWAPLKVTNATKIKLENITASKGTEIFASSEDDVIYKLENNAWKKLTTGSSIAAGIGTDGKSIVIGIAKTGIPYKFASNKWTPMGTEQLSKITIGNQNYILGITLDDRLVKWDSKTKKWMDIPGKKETKITSIDDVAAIPSGTTVALDKFGNTYHKGSDAVSITAKGVEVKKATTTTVTTAVADKKVKTATTKKTVKTVSKKAAKKTVKKAAKKKLKKAIVNKAATTSTKRTSAKTTTPVKAKTASTTTTKSTATK